MREAIQNSADAHRKAADLPVSVRVEKRSLVGNEKAKLVAALGLDSELSSRKQAIDLPAGNALETIADPNIPLPVLVISDYNTHGLGGRWDGTGEHDHFGRLVINLGVDDKADAAQISGGSFGFGKTVYGKASGIGVVAFYSVFQPSEASDGVHARFMATGLFKAHEHEGQKYDGFAFFGSPSSDEPDEASPLVDEEAHNLAAACGLEVRTEHDFGTTILIIDCDYDTEAMKTAVELFWWPRLLRNELDVSLVEGETELFPRPKQNAHLRPFIACYQNIVSDTQDPPKAMVMKSERRIGSSAGPLEPGILSAILLDADNEYSNCVALMRGPGMVVKYYPCGSDSLEPCVGVFVADPDVEKILTFSEPQMHDDWDPNADRLKLKFPEDGERVVRAVVRRIETMFRDFQRKQEPPIPPGGLKPKELMRLLGRFLDEAGPNPIPPEPGQPRPVSISVSEDRVQQDGNVWDEATITLELRPEFEGEELTCTVTATHEILGDSSLRIVDRTEAHLEDENRTLLAKGTPPAIEATLRKGEIRKFFAVAPADEITTARIRVSVEEA